MSNYSLSIPPQSALKMLPSYFGKYIKSTTETIPLFFFTCLQYKFFENSVGKGEIAHKEVGGPKFSMLPVGPLAKAPNQV